MPPAEPHRCSNPDIERPDRRPEPRSRQWSVVPKQPWIEPHVHERIPISAQSSVQRRRCCPGNLATGISRLPDTHGPRRKPASEVPRGGSARTQQKGSCLPPPVPQTRSAVRLRRVVLVWLAAFGQRDRK